LHAQPYLIADSSFATVCLRCFHYTKEGVSNGTPSGADPHFCPLCHFGTSGAAGEHGFVHTLQHQGLEGSLVKKVALITALLAVSLSLGGCFVGKGPAPIGKGKAPAPVVTRG
jgi:hypothetical protein